MTHDFKDKKCGLCVYFDGAEGTAIMVGICRRFPPTLTGARSSMASYPKRGGSSPACAEHETAA